MADKRFITGEMIEEDMEEMDNLTIRPKYLQEYIGQSHIKSELKIYIQAAKNRNEALDHCLIYGPPGLGKTTLALVIANELEVNIQTTSGPAIERPGDLLAILNELEAGDILFIDEIHRLPRVVEEVLYSAMEDFYVDIVIGQGQTSQPIHFELPPFTLIGATTKAGQLGQPMRDRFGIMLHMDYYDDQDLQIIVERSATIFDVEINSDGAHEIARRSRGTPRIANRILRRVRDFAQVEGNGLITPDITNKALSVLKIDELGLDAIDRKILSSMIHFYQGGPVGISTIAVNISEDLDTIEDMYEPYLIQLGLIKRTQRGRVVTKKAYQHLGLPFEKEEENT